MHMLYVTNNNFADERRNVGNAPHNKLGNIELDIFQRYLQEVFEAGTDSQLADFHSKDAERQPLSTDLAGESSRSAEELGQESALRVCDEHANIRQVQCQRSFTGLIHISINDNLTCFNIHHQLCL